jgi:UDP-3-O-[3-hydroxymyristoyl] N-acetylglucosamine deacetylase
MAHQTTLKSSTVKQDVIFEGVGLHSGANVTLTLKPAKADHGIVFKRLDVEGKQALIPARYDLVTDTRLGTTLTNAHGVSISTVEHLMAALSGCGVDNAVVEVAGAEVPIMDGSSAPFVQAIEKTGLKSLDAHRSVLKIVKPVEIREGGSVAALLPNDESESGFGLDITIDFNHPLIAKHQRHYDFSRMNFGAELGAARTFGFEHEVEYLRSQGLARGGSLENAIVVGKEAILNPEGLRFADEFIRHKALDCLGDFALAGYRIEGQVVTYRPGHSINNKLLRALFADASAYRIVSTASRPNPVRHIVSAQDLASL